MSKIFLASIVVCTVSLVACHLDEKPVTKEAASNLAKEIESSVKHRQTTKLNNIFAADVFTRRISTASSKKIDRDFLAGVKKGIDELKFGQQIFNGIGATGSYELVKQYEKDQKQHLIFRFYSTGGINYHDYELVNTPDGIKAADVYIYLSGENLSKTMAETMMMMSEDYKDMSKEDLEKFQSLKKIRKLIANNEFEKANEYYEELPQKLKDQKLLQVTHVQIASGLGNEFYERAMEDFLKKYPKEPNMQLMMIDRYILKKEYPKAMECINTVDSMINKDPFLDYFRAILLKMEGSNQEAVACLERLNANMPEFGAGTVELISQYAGNNEQTKATALIRKYKKTSGFDSSSLENIYFLYPDLKREE